ncbi:MAG: peptidylprolyl isomerase [Gemmataceae bacterium]|nr:peptidylprolyl isomerase [Gemmataceae bacterium]MDW8263813.1 peptidylprolyl isomerase [Gemmataceae bacterium]
MRQLVGRMCWVVVVGSALLGLPAWGQTTPSLPAPKAVAATVNGQPILEVTVQRALKRVPPDKHAQARVEILNYLIDNLLVDQFLTEGKLTVDPKEIDARINQIKEEVKKEGHDFAKLMADMMLSEEELRTQVAADLRWEKYATAQASDKNLRDYFEKNRDMFDGSTVHARHILLAAGKDAAADEQVKAQLRQMRQQIENTVSQGLAKLPANADALTREKERARLTEEAFAALAKEKSICPSKDQGGDVGFFPRAGSMVEPFARAAFALKPYQLSDVVTTQFGHHLILVVERKPGKEVTFEKAKDEVREVYFDKLREAVANHVRPKAKIVIHSTAKP